MLKLFVIGLICALMSSCASQPSFERIRGNSQTMHQSGVSFMPPSDNMWYIVRSYTHETRLFLIDQESQETLVTVVEIFNMPKLESNISFLSLVKQNEKKAVKTGRFERITGSFASYNHKGASCVKKEASSKDYGAKRKEQYAIFEIYGMQCIHPYKKNIGVNIELSRKAPFEYKNELFKKWGQELLESITFEPFRI